MALSDEGAEDSPPPITSSRPLGVVAADLDRLVERLWVPVGIPHWPVVVTTGRLPDTHRPVEEYAVALGRDRPRYLLPLTSGRAVGAALVSGAALQGRRGRATARGAALAWRTGLLAPALRTRLTVGVDRRIPDHELPDWLLLRRLGQDLGRPDLSAVIPVRRAMPNAKPTGRLMGADGRTLGFVKVGWSPATAELVANETQVLRELDGRVGRYATPRVAAAGPWQHLNYLVAAPLPEHLQSLRDPPESMAEDLLAIADSGDRRQESLADSAYLDDVRARLDVAAAGVPDAAGVLRAALDRIVTAAAPGAVLEVGRWHGDWVSWNLARAATGRVAWDWEYSHRHVPVGFDLMHWHFQETLAGSDATLDSAVAAAHAAEPGLAALGVAPEARATVVDLYVVEILTRAAVLAARGCGWNPRLYPALLRR